MRTWKGVLTIRSPLSTSPAIRETDGAQSFSPEVAEVSRPTETHRAHLEGFQQPCSLAHSVCYPACSGQACPPDPTCCPLLLLCSSTPRLFRAHHTCPVIPCLCSIPCLWAVLSFPLPIPAPHSWETFSTCRLSFYSTLWKPFLTSLRLSSSLSLDCPQHRGSHRMMVKRGLLNHGSAAY